MFAGPLTRSKAETLSRYFFYGGFLGLPWLWFASCLLFMGVRKHNDVVRHYTTLSFIGFIVALVVFSVWFAVLYVVYPGSTLWVIQPQAGPKGSEFQPGLFSSTVYKNLV
eukprot:PhM_4_TR13088/c0_g1_i1/m.56696/K06170/PSENEN, PEN2; presenilin enhancer 2